MDIVGAVVLVLVVVVVIMVIATYNRLVGLRQNVEQGAADIDTQLRQRHELVPNLVNTVKGYAGHEKDVLDSVVSARNKAAQGAIRSEDEAQLKVSLDRLLALSESYPDLKASANFQTLQHELTHVEDKLAASRRALNAAVSRYNTGRERFPAVMFANLLGFRPADFHTLDDSERGVVDQVPEVNF